MAKLCCLPRIVVTVAGCRGYTYVTLLTALTYSVFVTRLRKTNARLLSLSRSNDATAVVSMILTLAALVPGTGVVRLQQIARSQVGNST